MVFLIRILRVGASAVRGALAEGIIAILYPLAIEELLVRNRGMLVATQKKEGS